MDLIGPSHEVTKSDIDSGPDPGPPEHSRTEALIESVQPQPAPMAPAGPNEIQSPEPDCVAELDDISFLPVRRVGSRWRRPLTRLTLSFLILIMLLGLAGQIALRERDWIIAQKPSLRPWFLAFCAPFNCKLSALKDKNSIVIDGASFSKIAGDSYRLTFTLRNTSTVNLAVPAIELTLTDSLDQPVLRRVLLPTELDLKSETLAVRSERSTSLIIAVNLESAGPQVVGYRLYAFYP